jgi:hypothetical protein
MNQCYCHITVIFQSYNSANGTDGIFKNKIDIL